MNTRRQFLIRAPLGVLVAAAACGENKQTPPAAQTQATPGAPPAFATAPGVGPAITPERSSFFSVGSRTYSIAAQADAHMKNTTGIHGRSCAASVRASVPIAAPART